MTHSLDTRAAEGATLRARDTEARRLAQTCFDVPLVVEAGAGTGKTSVLVARVVAWALGRGWERAARGGGEPERIAPRVLRRIVAITFTEAAAAEMGERVASALREIQRGSTPVGVAPDALPDDPSIRVVRATALRSAIDQLRVHTIHAFCRRLLAESPLELGLHPQLEVDADQSAQEGVVREVLAAALPELFTSSQAMLALVAAGQGPSEIEAALLSLVQAAVPPDALAGEAVTDADAGGLLSELRDAASEFLACERGRLLAVTRAKTDAETALRVAELAERVTSASASSAGSTALDQVIQWLTGEWSKRDRLGDYAKGKLTKSAEAAIGDDAGELARVAGVLAALLEHVASLDLELLRHGREVLAPLHARVCEILRARGIESFSALLRDARALVAQPAAAVRIRSEIDQLLVDEVQDTDPLQCDLVRTLALAGDRERRPGLFLVGDPKQSIYGWRSADLLAYQDLVDDVVAAGGRVLPLVVNHRSAPCVLEEVSRIVRPVMIPERGLQPAFQVLLPSESRADDPGFDAHGCAPIEHWLSCDIEPETRTPVDTRKGDAAAVEARAVASEIARLHAAGEPWRHFGLLLRASTDLETYLDALRGAGVPFAVDGDRRYYQRREIIEACALLRCVLDRNDELALLTVLRSGMAGVPDAALLPLWAHGLPAFAARLYAGAAPGQAETEAAIEAMLDAVARELSESHPRLAAIDGWADATRATLRAIGVLRASYDDDPADVFVERMRSLSLFEVTESLRYLGAYRLANLDRFFRDLLEHLETAGGDPHALLRALRSDVSEAREREEGKPRDAMGDAVQVMTIHKAKGLAFEHVYVLQTHKGSRRIRESRVEMCEGRCEYRLLGSHTLGYHAVEARREEVERCERIRTLYVALTRARRRIVIAGLPDDKESHSAMIGAREGGRLTPDDVLARIGPNEDALDADGARWVLPALRGPAEAASVERRGAIFDSAEVQATAEILAEQRRRAMRVSERPWSAPISRASHEALADLVATRRDDDESEDGGFPRAPRLAVAPELSAHVGTAIHRMFERLDLLGDVRAGLAASLEDLEADLRRTLDPVRAEDAVAAAHEILDRFAGGPLLDRLRTIAPHVLARELPVLLPPPSEPLDSEDAAAPVGHLAGAVDFLYRDPDTGAFVVGDWKTDRVSDAAALDARVAAYAEQGRGYVRAVAEALDLPEPPRFELWMVAEGIIRTIA